MLVLFFAAKPQKTAPCRSWCGAAAPHAAAQGNIPACATMDMFPYAKIAQRSDDNADAGSA
jgi:hypothetical protein